MTHSSSSTSLGRRGKTPKKMSGYIASIAASLGLDRYKNATHIELQLTLHPSTTTADSLVISPTVFSAIYLKDKRKGIYAPRETSLILYLPLISDLHMYSLRASVRLFEVTKGTIILSEVSHICSSSAFASLIDGQVVEDSIPLIVKSTGGSAQGPPSDFIKLSLSYHKPLRKVNSTANECLRLDSLIFVLSDIVLPVSKQSYFGSQPLLLRICTDTYAASYPLMKLSQRKDGKILYRLVSQLPVFVPYAPVCNFQVAMVCNITTSRTHFRFNYADVGRPSSTARSFCDYLPLYQLSISTKRTLHSHQSHGLPISLSFPDTLVSSDLISFCDVIYKSIQIASGSDGDKRPRSPQSVNELFENLHEALFPHIFEDIFLRGGDTANVFAAYGPAKEARGAHQNNARFKAYDRVLSFVGLTDTLLAKVGKDWTELATARSQPHNTTTGQCADERSMNRFMFILTPLLDAFEPYSSFASKRNNTSYSNQPTLAQNADQDTTLSTFEALNCATRARDMLYPFPDKKQAKSDEGSCITILPIETSMSDMLLTERAYMYTAAIYESGAAENSDPFKASAVVAAGPVLAKQNRALWSFTLEDNRHGLKTMAAGPIVGPTQTEASLGSVVKQCRTNAELTYPQYGWILPQVVGLPDSVSLQHMLREKVMAFEDCMFVIYLYDMGAEKSLARGSLQIRSAVNTFVSAATANLDVEIKLRWFYTDKAAVTTENSVDTITFLASFYGFLKELQPVEAEDRSDSDDHTRVSMQSSGNHGRTIRILDCDLSRLASQNESITEESPAAVSARMAIRQSSRFSPQREAPVDCPVNISNISHVTLDSIPRRNSGDTLTRTNCDKEQGSGTPRLLSGKEIDILDGTVTFSFRQTQARDDAYSTYNNGPWQCASDDVAFLKGLIHKLRKELDQVSPMTFKQAVTASPSTYSGINLPVSDDLRRKLEVCTGISLPSNSTAFGVCQELVNKLDKNILAYFLVEAVKQGVQLSRELDRSREKACALEAKYADNSSIVSKLKALVLEQEQLLQYMETQLRRANRKNREVNERLAVIERENSRLNDLMRVLANSLNKVGAREVAVAVTTPKNAYSRPSGTRASPALEDGNAAVLMSVKLPPGRLPPLTPTSECVSPIPTKVPGNAAKRKDGDGAFDAIHIQNAEIARGKSNGW